MTITQAPSAPLVAVVGATGTQGGSVIRALAESDKPYRVRGFTRDAAKPSARELVKLGVDVVVVSLSVDNRETVLTVFNGADFAFLMTNYFEHLDKNREIAEGKLLIDAAKAGGVSRIVWAGMPSVNDISSGKYVHVENLDSKAIITAYGRQCGVPLVDVQPGVYGTNFLHNAALLSKQDDGSFAIPWPTRPTLLVPLVDAGRDYGLFVRQVLEAPVFPDGSEITAYGEMIPVGEMARQLAEGTGKNVVFKQLSAEEFGDVFRRLGLPPHLVLNMVDSFLFFDEFGWKVTTSPDREGLARRPSTWAEFVKSADWSKVLT
ncbi:NAD(P)-binding protein [Mycena crocata]|nr:NAD(P)-binding protein [Mycena crocata]